MGIDTGRRNSDHQGGFDRVEGEFAPLDPEKWLADHDVAAEGARLGKDNLPASNARRFDAMERHIIDYVNQEATSCRENVSAFLSDQTRKVLANADEEELQILAQKVSVDEAAGLGNIEGALQRGLDSLLPLGEDVARARRDFDAFRQSAGLTRLADYSHRKAALWVILAFFTIEVALNATLLMDVNVFGLVGAIGQMSLISAVNVLILGCAMGALLRRTSYVSTRLASASWLGVLIIVGLVCLFNLSVGHFRDAMAAIVDDPSAELSSMGADAIQRFVTEPVGLASFESALLVLLGASLFGVASWKWLQRDDPYPDYGRRDREVKALDEAYRAAYNRAKSALDAAPRDTMGKLEDTIHQLEIKKSVWKDTFETGRKVVADYGVNIAKYQFALDFLLSAYRTANSNARKEEAPAHFDEQVLISQEILEAPDFTPPPQTALVNIAEEAHTAVARLQARHGEAVRQFPTLVTLHGEKS